MGTPKFLQEELSIYETEMDKHLAVAWFNQSGYEVNLQTTIQLSDTWVKTKDLYANYRNFAMDAGVMPLTIEQFSEFLAARGAKKDQKTRMIFNSGIKKNERSVFWLNLTNTTANSAKMMAKHTETAAA